MKAAIFEKPRLQNLRVTDNAKNIYLRGSVFVSGGALNTITLNLYDASQCPQPD